VTTVTVTRVHHLHMSCTYVVFVRRVIISVQKWGFDAKRYPLNVIRACLYAIFDNILRCVVQYGPFFFHVVLRAECTFSRTATRVLRNDILVDENQVELIVISPPLPPDRLVSVNIFKSSPKRL